MSDGPIFLISDSEDEAPVKAKNNPPLQVNLPIQENLLILMFWHMAIWTSFVTHASGIPPL